MLLADHNGVRLASTLVVCPIDDLISGSETLPEILLPTVFQIGHCI